MEAIMFVQGLLDAGFTFLQNHGKFKSITVVCSDGNHSRITKKQSWGVRTGNALEWMMYNNLARFHPECTWVINKSLHTYVKVYDQTLRFHHGDTVCFNGGVGGFFPVLLRKIMQWNQTTFADMTIQGHW